MTDDDLDEYVNTANGEDHPGDMWFIDVVTKLVAEVRRLRAESAAERERCAQLCEDYARGAGTVNAAGGRPIDTRQDLELAGDILAARIREGG